jgi:hypothetical protein
VKCDETKPQCSSCRKASRPCSYKYADTVKAGDPFIAQDTIQQGRQTETEPEQRAKVNTEDQWQLRASRRAPGGKGTFQTMCLKQKSQRSTKPRLSDCVSLAPLIEDTSLSLAARWHWTMNPMDASMCPFSVEGPWTSLVPSLIGHSQAIDAAAIYALDSIESYRRNQNHGRYTTPKSASVALTALRDALDADDRLANTTHVVAVGLILAAEVSTTSFFTGLCANSRLSAGERLLQSPTRYTSLLLYRCSSSG